MSAFSALENARLVRNEEGDRVSLLIVDEAERYFTSDADRRIDFVYELDMRRLEALKREHEKLDGVDSLLGKLRVGMNKKRLWEVTHYWYEWSGWWLRPTGSMIAQKDVPYVAGDGSIRGGMHAARSLYIRPAIWIALKSKQSFSLWGCGSKADSSKRRVAA